jgi:hypothetical protein
MIAPFAAKLGRAPGVFGALALLAGCGPPSMPTQVNLPSIFSSAATPPRSIAGSQRRTSWIDGHVQGPLLYVSDSTLDVVFVFRWPALHLIGNLSGLRTPQGLCVDRSGDIWVANTKRSEMLEFARGSTKLIKTLPDRGQYPVGCALSANGDLAVTNIVSLAGHKQYGPGSLSIYKDAGGSPKVFEDSAMLKVYFDGYDSRGDLFVDGQDGSGAFAMAEFDGEKFTALTLSGATVNFPGAVVVTGSYVNVEDQLGSDGNSIMYRTTQSGTTLTVDATAQLLDGMDCVGSAIYGTGKERRLICPDAGTPSVNVYDYPAGGAPIKELQDDVYSPNSAAISP